MSVQMAGGWLREMRQRERMTLRQVDTLVSETTEAALGREIRVSQQELSRIEKGGNEHPAADSLCALALAYRVHIVDLLERYGYWPEGHTTETDHRIREIERAFAQLSPESQERLLQTMEMLLDSLFVRDARSNRRKKEAPSIA